MGVVVVISAADFQPVTLADQELFRQQYITYPQVHSDNSFANMICWRDFAGYRFARAGESIVLSSTIGGATKFRCPIGPDDPVLLREVLLLARGFGDSAPFVAFGEVDKARIARTFPRLPFHPDRDMFDYVYRNGDLSNLPGKKYLTIRHQLNRFRHRCAYRVEAVSEATLDELQDFLEKWCEWRDCDSSPVLAHEKVAILVALRHFTTLNLTGLIIRIDGKIGAMSLFEPLNHSTAVVHFEKGLPDCEGIYKAINAEVATILRSDYEYINRESDLGIEGLREAKMRYHPDHFVPAYVVRKEDIREEYLR